MAAKLYCKAHNYTEAYRLLVLHNRQDLLDPILDSGLIEGSATMTELLADCKSQLSAQVSRLRDLRVKKQADPIAFYGGDPSAALAGEDKDIPDDISLAPSASSTAGGTFMTRYTGLSSHTAATGATRRTSKNRRREERKRARGKKGSVYEEEYLVNSLARLMERVSDVSGEIQGLIEGLVRRRMRERAAAVQRALVEVREGVEACKGEVFMLDTDVKKKVGEEGDEEDGERPLGAEGVLWDSLQAEWRKKGPPVLKGFERLSLV
jgi:elongator complex protein 1